MRTVGCSMQWTLLCHLCPGADSELQASLRGAVQALHESSVSRALFRPFHIFPVNVTLIPIQISKAVEFMRRRVLCLYCCRGGSAQSCQGRGQQRDRNDGGMTAMYDSMTGKKNFADAYNPSPDAFEGVFVKGWGQHFPFFIPHSSSGRSTER